MRAAQDTMEACPAWVPPRVWPVWPPLLAAVAREATLWARQPLGGGGHQGAADPCCSRGPSAPPCSVHARREHLHRETGRKAGRGKTHLASLCQPEGFALPSPDPLTPKPEAAQGGWGLLQPLAPVWELCPCPCCPSPCSTGVGGRLRGHRSCTPHAALPDAALGGPWPRGS